MMRLSPIRLLVVILVSLFMAGSAIGQSLSDLRKAWESAKAANTSTASAEAAMLDWIKQSDAQTTADIEDVFWLARWLLSQGQRSEQFAVTWSGTVSAPTSGKYTFSTSPVNVNISEEDILVKQTMAVWIGDQQVLDTSQGTGAWLGTPVALEAGSKTPIRVEYSYVDHHGDHERTSDLGAVAVLYWDGPGISRAVVPTTALATASGAAGLDTKYVLSVKDTQQTATTVEPKIDRFWMKSQVIVPRDAQARQLLAARVGTMALDATYLDACAQGTASLIGHECCLLDSEQRQALVQAVLARPGILVRADRWRWSLLASCSRSADPDGSLDIVGQYLQTVPDGMPRVFKDIEFQRYWEWGKLAWQQPDEFARLERMYLVMPDGKCCLPVAYVLAYGYMGEGRLGEWIQKLQSRLEDSSVQGDLRVNWLVARAMAAELEGSAPRRALFNPGEYLRGRAWLEEACMVAQSEPVRLRAYQQLTARLAVTEDIDGANKLLDKLATKISDPIVTTALTAWRTQIAATADDFRKKHQEQETLAQKAYLDSLQAKRQQAIDQHDDESAAHYEQLLNAAQPPTN